MTDSCQMLRTFNDETPETSDVVLCHYCGATLHDPEHDVLWENNTSHRCPEMPSNSELVGLLDVKDVTNEEQAAFIKWWNGTHDFPWFIVGGLYEKHTYRSFIHGYREGTKSD